MTDKEKIKAEIKRQIAELTPTKEKIGIVGGMAVKRHLESILSFIDSLQEEPISEDWIEELRVKLDSMSKEDFKKVFDKYAIDFDEEPVSKELEKVSDKYSEDIESNYSNDMFDRGDVMKAFEAGAKWHEQQMMANAIDAEVLKNYDGKVLEYDDSILDEKLSNCEVFDKVKIIVIKKD